MFGVHNRLVLKNNVASYCRGAPIMICTTKNPGREGKRVDSTFIPKDDIDRQKLKVHSRESCVMSA